MIALAFCALSAASATTTIVAAAPAAFRPAAATIAGIAAAFAALSIVGVRLALGVSLVGFVTAYGIALAGREALDVRAPLVAAAILLTGEFAHLAVSPRRREVSPSDRVQQTLAVGLAAVLVGAIVLAVASPRVRGGMGFEVAGAAAAIGAFALLATNAHRLRTSSTQKGDQR